MHIFFEIFLWILNFVQIALKHAIVYELIRDSTYGDFRKFRKLIELATFENVYLTKKDDFCILVFVWAF